jgi:glycosyltransferase involved in cell wall biosynthesis
MIFKPQDAAQLAAKLSRLLTHEAEREEEAAWGKEFTKKFDVSVVGQQLLKQYNQVLRAVRNLP